MTTDSKALYQSGPGGVARKYGIADGRRKQKCHTLIAYDAI
jgi:hypothetical protein